MKQSTPKAKPVAAPLPTDIQTLQDKVSRAQKAVEKYWALYEKAAMDFQKTPQQGLDKLSVLQGLSAIKTAKLTYKIKKIELKLAKAALKLARKGLKKTAKAGSTQDNKKAVKKH